MTAEVKKIYKGALTNKEFIKDAYKADGDNPPNIFASSNEKVIYAMIYYGWLVGKYGSEWRLFI